MHGSHGKETVLDSFSRFIGRIEYEIEIYANHIFGCSAEELTARVGACLVSLTAHTQLDVASVPDMRVQTALPNKRLRKMAARSSSRSAGAHKAQVKSNIAKHLLKESENRALTKEELEQGKFSSIQRYWLSMTPEERSAEGIRRNKKAAKNKAA